MRGLHAGRRCMRVGITMPLSGGGGQKALTDGAPTFFRADQMLPCSRREVWRGTIIAHAIISACLPLASGRRWWAWPSTLEGPKNSIARTRGGRAACQACHAFCAGRPERSTHVAFWSDPLEPISAALRSSVLLERQKRAGGPFLLCEER